MAEGWQQVGNKKASGGSSSPVLVVSRRQLQQQHKATGAGQQGGKVSWRLRWVEWASVVVVVGAVPCGQGVSAVCGT